MTIVSLSECLSRSNPLIWKLFSDRERVNGPSPHFTLSNISFTVKVRLIDFSLVRQETLLGIDSTETIEIWGIVLFAMVCGELFVLEVGWHSSGTKRQNISKKLVENLGDLLEWGVEKDETDTIEIERVKKHSSFEEECSSTWRRGLST
jgi:hypothetical protein